MTDNLTIIQQPRKRQTALKLKISDLNSGSVISSNNLNFLEINGKKVTRVNVIANIIDKFVSEGEKRYAALTIDDASGQIRIKAFAEDIEKIKRVEIGDTILVVGNIRYFNNEIYILPEILKQVEPKWLVVRKLELEKREKKPTEQESTAEKIITEEKSKQEESNKVRKQIMDMLKKSEEGIDVDKIIMALHARVEEINSVITKMLEDAEIYEPKPGMIRLL